MTTSQLTLITGASRGLGRAMAAQLLQAGHTVLGISRRQDPQLAELAAKAGAELIQWEQDLSEPVAAAARVSAWLKSLDGQRFDGVTLINNAGTVGNPAPLASAVPAELAQALRIGLEAPMLLTAAFQSAR